MAIDFLIIGGEIISGNSGDSVAMVSKLWHIFTAWKVCKYEVISGPYFSVFELIAEIYQISVFSPNTGKYGSEKTLYLDTFHAVQVNFNTKVKYFWDIDKNFENPGNDILNDFNENTEFDNSRHEDQFHS